MTGAAPSRPSSGADPGRRALPRGIRRLTGALLAVQALLAAVNLTPLVDRYTVARLVDVNAEATLASWFSATLLLLVAGAAAAVGLGERGLGAPVSLRRGWAMIAAVFVLLSADEAAALHELAGEKASRFLEIEALPSLYTWVLVVAPAAALLALWMARWFTRNVGARTTAGRLVLAALGLWLLVPVLEAADPSLGGARVLVVVEESLEMVGETLMLAGILTHGHHRGMARGIAEAFADRSGEVGGPGRAAPGDPYERAAAGSNSARGASPQSRSRS
jgi:hypothetical protein